MPVSKKNQKELFNAMIDAHKADGGKAPFMAKALKRYPAGDFRVQFNAGVSELGSDEAIQVAKRVDPDLSILGKRLVDGKNPATAAQQSQELYEGVGAVLSQGTVDNNQLASRLNKLERTNTGGGIFGRSEERREVVELAKNMAKIQDAGAKPQDVATFVGQYQTNNEGKNFPLGNFKSDEGREMMAYYAKNLNLAEHALSAVKSSGAADLSNPLQAAPVLAVTAKAAAKHEGKEESQKAAISNTASLMADKGNDKKTRDAIIRGANAEERTERHGKGLNLKFGKYDLNPMNSKSLAGLIGKTAIAPVTLAIGGPIAIARAAITGRKEANMERLENAAFHAANHPNLYAATKEALGDKATDKEVLNVIDGLQKSGQGLDDMEARAAQPGGKDALKGQLMESSAVNNGKSVAQMMAKGQYKGADNEKITNAMPDAPIDGQTPFDPQTEAQSKAQESAQTTTPAGPQTQAQAAAAQPPTVAGTAPPPAAAAVSNPLYSPTQGAAAASYHDSPLPPTPDRSSPPPSTASSEYSPLPSAAAMAAASTSSGHSNEYMSISEIDKMQGRDSVGTGNEYDNIGSAGLTDNSNKPVIYDSKMPPNNSPEADRTKEVVYTALPETNKHAPALSSAEMEARAAAASMGGDSILGGGSTDKATASATPPQQGAGESRGGGGRGG